KVDELESSNADLNNLLVSTDLATIFLDRQLRVRRFTPTSRRVLNLIPSDVGRPISDLTLKFKDEHLLRDSQQVLERLTPIEAEVRSDEGRWFLRRVLPYRDHDDRIDGVVITLSDVSPLKQFSEKMRRLATVLTDSSDAHTVRDPDGRII